MLMFKLSMSNRPKWQPQEEADKLLVENSLLNDLIPCFCFGKYEYEPDSLQAFHRLKQQLHHRLTVKRDLLFSKLIILKD